LAHRNFAITNHSCQLIVVVGLSQSCPLIMGVGPSQFYPFIVVVGPPQSCPLLVVVGSPQFCPLIMASLESTYKIYYLLTIKDKSYHGKKLP
jgi:hypothetical protein